MTYGGLFAFIGTPFGHPFAYLVILIVALLLFGNRLPGMMRSLGRSVVEFRKGVSGVEDGINDVVRSVDDQAKAEMKAEKKETEAQS